MLRVLLAVCLAPMVTVVMFKLYPVLTSLAVLAFLVPFFVRHDFEEESDRTADKNKLHP